VGSHLLKALLVIAIVIFFGKRMPLWLARSRSSGYSQIHPIEQLHEQHLEHFVRKLQDQSKTLQAANREYERRYGRVPPEGFDAWFNLAKSHSFIFIDEFDGIMHAIQVLWDIPSSVLRSRLEYARYERAQGLAFFEVNSGKVDFLGSSGSGDLERALFRRLERISGMGVTLPDVIFFLNTLDEPRVFAHEQDVARSLSNVTTWQSYEPSSATTELQKTCSQSQSLSRSGNTQDYGRLSFISNTAEFADYCLHPDLFQQHGFLQAPETFIPMRDTIPVLSACAAAHFSVIIFPSVYYEMLQAQDAASGLNPDLEPPWEDKKDVLYWSGSSTGMHATTENWGTGHRQRLAMDLGSSTADHRNVTLLDLVPLDGHRILLNSHESVISSTSASGESCSVTKRLVLSCQPHSHHPSLTRHPRRSNTNSCSTLMEIPGLGGIIYCCDRTPVSSR